LRRGKWAKSFTTDSTGWRHSRIGTSAMYAVSLDSQRACNLLETALIRAK
jgi:hypothetical protein